jgi:hypothetical protein
MNTKNINFTLTEKQSICLKTHLEIVVLANLADERMLADHDIEVGEPSGLTLIAYVDLVTDAVNLLITALEGGA